MDALSENVKEIIPFFIPLHFSYYQCLAEDHLFSAAFFAISCLLDFERALARACPPLLAPSLPKATANGFFILTGGGTAFGGSWPVVWAAMLAASELRLSASSNFFLLRRVGMRQTIDDAGKNARGKL